MTYIAAADLRDGALYPYIDIPSSGNGAVADARLTAMIGAATNIIDTYCKDHFEASAATTLRIQGDGSLFLRFPRRIRAITTVTLTDYAGTDTAFDNTYWRVHSSFKTEGDANTVVSPTGTDGLELKKELTVGDTNGNWPTKHWGFVEVVGDFDWAATPEVVKWAAAQLVWSWCRSDLPPGVESIDTGAAVLRRGTRREDSTGLAEVDAQLAAAGLRRTQFSGTVVV